METQRKSSDAFAASRMVTLHACPFPGCGKKFDRKYNLKCHRRIHSDEKPYLCSHAQCPRAFRWKSSLNHHLMSLDHISPKDRLARKSARAARRRPPRRTGRTTGESSADAGESARLHPRDRAAAIAHHLSELQALAPPPPPPPPTPPPPTELFVRGALADPSAFAFAHPARSSPPASLSSITTNADDDLVLDAPDLSAPADASRLFAKSEPAFFAPKPEPALFAPDVHALDVMMLSDALADAGAEHALSIY